jgi:hypothetical protein
MSASPVDLRALVRTDHLPWSRARATQGWIRAFASLAGIRLAILLSLPFVAGIAVGELARELVAAAAFPALFLFIVTFSQRRYLRRPPKAVLAMQLACFCAGAALQLLAILSDPSIARIAAIVLSGSTILLGGWFLGVLLVPED